MRRKRRKRHGWTMPLGWVLAIGMVFVAIPISEFVTDHLRTWAGPLVWLAIATGLLATMAYFWSTLPGWVLAPIIGFAFGFSLLTSAVSGWQAQLQIGIALGEVVYGAACIAFVVASVVMVRRLNRRMSTALREVGEEIHTDALFRDDGERIVVHPHRGRLLRLTIMQIMVFAACGAVYYWALTLSANLLVFFALGAFAGLIMLIALLNIARLVMRRPGLVIGPDGVLDNVSQIVTGRGLLRWDELMTVFEYTYKTGRFNPTQRMLGIVLTDYAAVRKRQPRWKRALGFLGASQLPGMIVIARMLLDKPPDALATEIKRYARRHAPRGWDSPLITEVDSEDTDERAKG